MESEAQVAFDWLTLIGILVPMMIFFLASTYAVIGYLFKSNVRLLINRIENVEQSVSREAGNVRELDRRVLEMRGDLPNEYVRRSEWLRSMSLVEARYETLSSQINRVLERLADSGKSNHLASGK